MKTTIRASIAFWLIVLLHGCGGDGIAGTGIGSDGSSDESDVVVGPSTEADPAEGGDSASPSTPPAPPASSLLAMHGTVEKGPFDRATVIRIAPVASNGDATREPVDIPARTDLGSYSFTLYQAVALRLVANGRYLNEVTGRMSVLPVTLYAYLDAKNELRPRANINVLTHLAFERTRHLLRNGVSEPVAIAQARDEVVAALSSTFGTASIPLFTELSVYNSTVSSVDGNAYLLAVSASVMRAAMRRADAGGGDVDAELVGLLDEFTGDFAADGTLDAPDWPADVTAASRSLDPDAVRATLRAHAVRVTGAERTVADLNLFIDTDGDGVVNATDTDDDNDTVPDAVDPLPYTTPASSAAE